MSPQMEYLDSAAVQSIGTDAIRARSAIRSVLELPLHSAVNQLMTSGEFDISALRGQLRQVCIDAKRQGVRAEQVLIAVKEIWATLAVPRDWARGRDGKPVWNRLVALTLDEYFDPSNPTI